MAIYTFDTSVIIAFRVRELPPNFLLSAAVIAELTAGARDDSTRKVFEAMRRDYDRLDVLIVPTSGDWLNRKQNTLLAIEGSQEEIWRQTSPWPPVDDFLESARDGLHYWTSGHLTEAGLKCERRVEF